MIQEHGVVAGGYSASASVKVALDTARAEGSVAWVAATDPGHGDFRELAEALGVDPGRLAVMRRQRSAEGIDRSRVSLFSDAQVINVVMLDFGWPPTGESGGRLELLAGRHGIAVLSYGWHEPIENLREAVTVAGEPAQTSAGILELIIGRAFDHYDGLLNQVEDAVERVTEDVLTRRDPEQLGQIVELFRPVHAAVIAIEPFVHGLDDVGGEHRDHPLARFGRGIRGDAAYLASRTERLSSALDSLQQTYFSLSQDETNRIGTRQSEITKRLSGWTLLLAVPTISFSLYGTNFQNVTLIQSDWGYPVMLVFTSVMCLVIYWRLRRSGWL